MGLNDGLPDGATPLDGEELEGLLPTHLVNRISDKSIGADWRQIRLQVPALLGDITYQVEHQVEPVDQIAIRFHHRLVSIHPFPNGNGRHAHLIADVLIEQLGAPRFSWGGSSYLAEASILRQRYISALQQADRGDICALLAFARAG